MSSVVVGYRPWVDGWAGTVDAPVATATAVGLVQVVALRGRLSSAHVAQVRDAVNVAAGGSKPVVVDLSAVLLIDAAVARALRTSITRQARRGHSIGAAGAHAQPLHVLELFGIDKEIGAYRSLAEAIEEARTDISDPRASAEVFVHGLISAAREMPVGDPRRTEMENQAIEAALPFARSLARRYAGRGESLDDLVQVASLGVVRAVHGYDPHHGAGFRAYAVPTILGELKRHFRDHAWVVRPPRRLQELRIAIASVGPSLAQEWGREPTAVEFAARLGVAAADVEHAMAAADGLAPTSLDAPAHVGEAWTLNEIVGADDPGIELAECRVVLNEAIAELPARARDLLELRFGAELTQTEIAERLGTSQMSVSRSLASIVGKLRRAMLAQD